MLHDPLIVTQRAETLLSAGNQAAGAGGIRSATIWEGHGNACADLVGNETIGILIGLTGIGEDRAYRKARGP
jgi:hypothetical protein